MSDTPSDLFGSISISQDQQKSKPSAKKPAPSSRKKKGPARKQKKSSRGAWKLALLISILALVYNGIGYLAIPHLVKTTGASYLSDKLHVKIAIGDARFNPYTFNLFISGLSAETAEDGEPHKRFLSASELQVDLDLLSLLRGDFVCSSMDVNGLNIEIIRDGAKRYNLSYLLRGTNAKTPSEIINFAELPFLFSFNNIKISNGQILFDDQSTKKTHHIEQIELALPTLSNFPYQIDSYIHPRFSAIVNGSPIKLTGEATLTSGLEDGRQTILSCDLNDIDVPLYFDYLPVTLPVDVFQGKANGKLQISFSSEQKSGSKLEVQFSITTDNLGLESRNSKLSLVVPTAKFEGSIEPFNQTLAIQDILLREPTLTSDGFISRETLANLIPLTLRPTADDPLYKVIPSVSVKLLIADGGSVIIKKQDQKKPVRIWHSLQLSVKDFINTRQEKDESKSTATFRLSGEHLSTSAFFTWQGQFDDSNRPSGNLQLNSVSASLIAPFLGREAQDIKGIADVSGLLSLSLSQDETKPFTYTLKSTKVSIKNLHLLDQGIEWLFVPTLRCEPVSHIDNVTDLGNVYLPNSSVMLNQDKLPYLFKRFSEKPTRHIIHGIDFSGTIAVVDPKEKKPIIELSNTLLQANRLEQQQVTEENFVFSATLNTTGSIKTKGILRLAPLQINTGIAFSMLTPRQLFSWFSNTATLTNSQAVMSGQGAYRYPEMEFEGELIADDIIIGDLKNPVFRASKTRFDKIVWSRIRKDLSIKYVLVDQPECSWLRQVGEANPITSASVFLRHIFLPEPDRDTADPDMSLSTFRLSIDQIDFNDGAVSYNDKRVSPDLALGITGINGSLNSLIYPIAEKDSNFSLNGNIEGYPFTLEGGAKLLQDPPSARVDFTAQSLPLSLFEKQSSQKLPGLDVSKADAAISTSTTITNRAIDQRSTLTISNLFPTKSGTPEATALALLTKSDGSIPLSLESESTYPSSPLLKEILSSIGTTVIKASINPLLLASEEFKDLVEQQYITFQPGSAELSSHSVEHLGRYSEFLAGHPLVKLQITGLADQERDAAALLTTLREEEAVRNQEENKKRKQEWQTLKDAEQARLEEQLRQQQGSQIKEVDISHSKIPPFVSTPPRTVTVTDSMLKNLALEREDAVLNFLTTNLGLSATRLERDKASRTKIVSNDAGNRVLLQLSDMFFTQNQ